MKTRETLSTQTQRNNQLARYCVGGAALACTVTTADAAIVFVNFGNQLLFDQNPNNGSSQFFGIDFDGNGTIDFRLRQRIDSSIGNLAAIQGPVGGNVGVMGFSSSGYNYPFRLQAGSAVGPGGSFLTLTSTTVGSMAAGNGYPNSQWTGGQTGFLGIRFTISGVVHYGWVQLAVAPITDAHPYGFTLIAGGYETLADTAIAAGAVPEPSTVTSLGLVALGAVGLLAHRRRSAQKAAA